MKHEAWQKVYAPEGNMLGIRVKNTLAALSEEPERSMGMKKILVIGLAAVMVMAVGAVGASGLFAAQYDPVRLANAALAEEYGITDEMQTYFRREVIEEDGVTTVILNSMEDMEHVLGQYVVTIKDGVASVRWSHDGQSTEGGLDAMAWGAEQIELLIEMAKEENGFARGHRKAQELRVFAEDGEILLLVNRPEETDSTPAVPLDPDDPSIHVSEETCIALAKEAFAQEYSLSPAQLDRMEYNAGYAGYTFAMKDGQPVCVLYFWLHQQDEEYHTDKDGIYWAVIDAQSGEVLDVQYDSALAGNG